MNKTINWDKFYSKEITMRDYFNNLYTHNTLFEEVCKDKPDRILEVGVGTGIMSLFLSYLGYEVIGIDNNETVLDKAKDLNKKLNGKVEYVLTDAFNLERSFKPKIFDIVFSQGFFEHFNDAQIYQLINQQLKVGKKIIFSVPSKFYPVRNFGDERLLDINSWKKILKYFEIDYIKYYGFFLPARNSIYKFIFNPYLIYKFILGTFLKERSHVLIKILP